MDSALAVVPVSASCTGVEDGNDVAVGDGVASVVAEGIIVAVVMAFAVGDSAAPSIVSVVARMNESTGRH